MVEVGRGGEVLGVCGFRVYGWCLFVVMFFDFEVRVEVEDNFLVGFGGVNNLFVVLVGWIILGVIWGGDVVSVFGI